MLGWMGVPSAVPQRGGAGSGRGHRGSDTRGPLEIGKKKAFQGMEQRLQRWRFQEPARSWLLLVMRRNERKWDWKDNLGPDKEGLLFPFSCVLEQENVLNT